MTTSRIHRLESDEMIKMRLALPPLPCLDRAMEDFHLCPCYSKNHAKKLASKVP
jgi:hypothetical protein